MKSGDKTSAADVMGLLQNGGINRRDMSSLLISLREHIDKQHTMLLDITHCIAHTKRDKGYAFNYITSFSDHISRVAKKGGSFKSEVLFPIAEVIDELYLTLKSLGIDNVSKDALTQQSDLIQNLLAEILDETEFDIRHKHVDKCLLTKLSTNERSYFTFTIYFKGLQNARALRISRSVGLSFPVFSP